MDTKVIKLDGDFVLEQIGPSGNASSNDVGLYPARFVWTCLVCGRSCRGGSLALPTSEEEADQLVLSHICDDSWIGSKGYAERLRAKAQHLGKDDHASQTSRGG